MKAIYDNEIWSVTETCAGKDIPKTSFGLAGQPGRDNNVEQDWLQLNGLIWVPSDARGLAVDPTDGEVEGLEFSPVGSVGTYNEDDEKLREDVARREHLFLGLFHGRVTPDEDCFETMPQNGGWGRNGPILGPLKWCHFTYMTPKLAWWRGDTESVDSDLELWIDHGMIVLNGIYYGDWTLFVPKHCR